MAGDVGAGGDFLERDARLRLRTAALKMLMPRRRPMIVSQKNLCSAGGPKGRERLTGGQNSM